MLFYQNFKTYINPKFIIRSLLIFSFENKMEKRLTLNDVAIKARSKKKVYYVLTMDGGIY